MVNFNLTTALSWTYMSILINTALTKIPITYKACWFSSLGKYWKSVRMAAVPRGCAPAGPQLQEETETVSALASLTVDVEQPFAQEDSRYGSNVGESCRSVTSRLLVNVQEARSRLPPTCLLHFHHLSSPKPQMPQHMLSAVENSFVCFILHGKHSAGACGCSSRRDGGDEIDVRKITSWWIIQCRLSWKELRMGLPSALVISILPDVLFFLLSF